MCQVRSIEAKISSDFKLAISGVDSAAVDAVVEPVLVRLAGN